MPPDTDAAALTPQSPAEMLAITRAYLSRRGVSKNWLCGQNLLFMPPFSAVAVDNGQGQTLIIVQGRSAETGNTEEQNFPCTHVTTGRFREDILFTQAGQPPTFRRLVPLQPARVKLLNTIKVAEHLSHGDFREATRKDSGEVQGEATRRWRELGWEFGFSAYEEGGNYYRGSQVRPIRDPLPRPDMTALTRAMLPAILERGDAPICAKCARAIQLPGTEGDLFPGVIDHRRPVAYGGSDELDNLHLYCRQCNNVKAHTCRNCPINYECERCTWAFPHKFLDTLTVYLTPPQVSTLLVLAEQAGQQPDDYARQLLKGALDTSR